MEKFFTFITDTAKAAKYFKRNKLEDEVVKFIKAHNRRVVDSTKMHSFIRFLQDGINLLNATYPEHKAINNNFVMHDTEVPWQDIYWSAARCTLHIIQCTTDNLNDRTVLVKSGQGTGIREQGAGNRDQGTGIREQGLGIRSLEGVL